MSLVVFLLLILQLKAAVSNDSLIDHMVAEASEPNVIQIDAYGKVSTNSEPEMDDRRLMLEEMRLRREMMMRRRRQKDGPTIIMMPGPAPPASPEPVYAPSYSPPPASDPDRYLPYDTKTYGQSKSCFVTTNVCDRSQDDAIKKTVHRTVQKSIETSVKQSLKQALVPLVEELTRRMAQDLPQPLPQPEFKKYQQDMHAYASRFLETLL
jgi:hypothetical protein